MKKFMPNFRSALLGASALLALAGQAQAANRIDEKQVFGAWRLVHTEMRWLDGHTSYVPNYGPNPQGYIVYDRSHVMCVYLALAPQSDAEAPAEFKNANPPMPASYCGRWWVEPSGGALIHDVAVGNDPAIVGTQLRRQITLDGDTLYIRRSPTPAGLADYVLQFERVRSAASAAK